MRARRPVLVLVVLGAAVAAAWTSAPWVSDLVGGAWSSTRALTGRNAGFPLYDTQKVAFKAPAGPAWLRFRFVADGLVGSPYTGVAVDDVAVRG